MSLTLSLLFVAGNVATLKFTTSLFTSKYAHIYFILSLRNSHNLRNSSIVLDLCISHSHLRDSVNLHWILFNSIQPSQARHASFVSTLHIRLVQSTSQQLITHALHLSKHFQNFLVYLVTLFFLSHTISTPHLNFFTLSFQSFKERLCVRCVSACDASLYYSSSHPEHVKGSCR